MVFTLIFFAVAAVIIFATFRTGQWQVFRLALGPDSSAWKDIVPQGVASPPQCGSLTGVVATGYLPGASKKRLWIVFDEQHLMATRIGSLGRDAPLMLEKESASPAVVSGSGWWQRVSFGGGVLPVRAPRTPTDPLLRRLRERGWVVLDAGQAPVAGWYPDPTGRHELRYWDGTAWTDFVHDGDRSDTDPL